MYPLFGLLFLIQTSRTSTEGYCGSYHGNICKNYILNTKQVWYNNSGGYENEVITTALWDELIVPLEEPCRSAAEELLCFYAFPDCNVSKPLPLCYQDCIAVKELFCYKDWALIEDKKDQGIFVKSRGHFRLPDCSILPKYNKNSVECSYAGLTELKLNEVTYDCVKGRGRFYQGKVNVTKNGIPCQRWDSQTPHTHDSPPNIFPELENAENYCRNAGGEEKRPWCFTTNPDYRWQHCDIPRCPNSTVDEVDTKTIAM